MTHITSEPPGAKIEVNEYYVGVTPCDVPLPQTPDHHKLKGAVVVRAVPGAPGQVSQIKVLRRHQIVPDSLFFRMWPDAAVGPPAQSDSAPEENAK